MDQENSRAEASKPNTSDSVSNKRSSNVKRKSNSQKTEQLDAKASIDSIMAELECSICLELFLAPYSLPCGHIFCGPCLSGWFSVRNYDNGRCPECRKSTFLIGAGLDGLIPAYKLETVIVAVEKFLPKNQMKIREERRTEWVLLKEALSEKNHATKPPPKASTTMATLASATNADIGPSQLNSVPLPFNQPVFARGVITGHAGPAVSPPSPWIHFPEPQIPPLPTSTSSTFPNSRPSIHTPHRFAGIMQSQPHVIPSSSSTTIAQTNPVPTNANGGFGFEHSTRNLINFGYQPPPIDQFHFSPTLQQQQQQQQHNSIPLTIFNQPSNAPTETPAWWRHPSRVWSFDPSRGLWV